MSWKNAQVIGIATKHAEPSFKTVPLEATKHIKTKNTKKKKNITGN